MDDKHTHEVIRVDMGTFQNSKSLADMVCQIVRFSDDYFFDARKSMLPH